MAKTKQGRPKATEPQEKQVALYFTHKEKTFFEMRAKEKGLKLAAYIKSTLYEAVALEEYTKPNKA